MLTISEGTNPVSAMWFALAGGTFRIRLTDDGGPGRRAGRVLDSDGNEIGSASDVTYGGRGFSVWTRPFAGFVPNEQIEIVP